MEDSHESEELRSRALISFGAALDYIYFDMEEFVDANEYNDFGVTEQISIIEKNTTGSSRVIAEFPKRCLSFDSDAASRYAVIVAGRTQIGRPISVEDAQIAAAIAMVHNMTLTTRNTGDFELIEGLAIINPWKPETLSSHGKQRQKLKDDFALCPSLCIIRSMLIGYRKV